MKNFLLLITLIIPQISLAQQTAQGKYSEAIKLLEKAQKDELSLGYSEPPIYPHSVAISLAQAYAKSGKTDKVIW